MCQQFTNASGYFSSRLFPKPEFEIHSDRILDIVKKTVVLISVQPNHQIWLTFNKFVTYKDQHFIKVLQGHSSLKKIFKLTNVFRFMMALTRPVPCYCHKVDQVSHIPYGHHPATCSLNFHPTMT